MILPQPWYVRAWRWFVYRKLMLQTMVLMVCGRWYVFRNCPDWFVIDVAAVPDDEFSEDKCKDVGEEQRALMIKYVQEARNEMERRCNKLIRQIEAMSEAATALKRTTQ